MNFDAFKFIDSPNAFESDYRTGVSFRPENNPVHNFLQKMNYNENNENSK
jgi:hypothetical protein